MASCTASVRLKDVALKVIFAFAALGASTAAGMTITALGDSRDRLGLNVRDFGATGDCLTDDYAAIQRAVAQMKSGSALYFPPTPGTGCYKITDEIGPPAVNGLTFFGAGRRTSRIKQVTQGKDIFNFGAPSTNGTVIRDLWVDGAGVARYGLNWDRVFRGRIIGNRISRTATAGIFLNNVIIAEIQGNEFDGNKDGILETGGPVSPPNGISLIANIFENQTGYGLNLYQAFGWLVTGNTIESNAKGGMRVTTVGGGIDIRGNYFEENRDGTNGTFDLSIGSRAAVGAGVVEANYFNGSKASSDTSDYYPIRFHRGHGWRIARNHLNVGNRFLNFEPGGAVSDSEFGPQYYHTGLSPTDATAIYGSIPPDFVNGRNRMLDQHVIPVDGGNWFKGDSPFSAWTVVAPGLNPFTRVPGSHDGNPVASLRRVDGNIAMLSQSFMISAINNARARSRWLTFSLDIYVNSPARQYFTLSLDDGGSQRGSVQYQAGVPDGWRTYSVSTYFGATTTTVKVQLSLDNHPLQLFVASPQLYSGLDHRVNRR